MSTDDVPSPFDPAAMWPVYERVCRVVRQTVVGTTSPEDGARMIIEDELTGTVAITATAVEILSGVGSLLVRSNHERLQIQTLNAMLGQPPAYRAPAFKRARDWMAYWANHQQRHWEL